jgi:chemotaxis protein CheD
LTFSRATPTGSANSRRINVLQGEHAVSSGDDVVLCTVLGSCIAACLYDADAGVGGMNHFLLPDRTDGAGADEAAMRYGAYSMEVLINDLMKRGARRDHLVAKLFGGAKMFDSLVDVGSANAAFARRFLDDEGIPIVGASVGGRSARRIEFWPKTGRARQREVDQQVAELKTAPARAPAPAADTGGVELF